MKKCIQVLGFLTAVVLFFGSCDSSQSTGAFPSNSTLSTEQSAYVNPSKVEEPTRSSDSEPTSIKQNPATTQASTTFGTKATSTVGTKVTTSDKTSIGEVFDYVVTRKANYIARLPKDMFKVADIVVKGRFEETLEPYVTEYSMPVTKARFAVEYVFKGEMNLDRVIVEYYGGTVPLSTYLETLKPEEVSKLGIDLASMDLSNATVTYAQTKESVSVNYDDTFLLFLAHNEENSRYFILCDAYGACKMKDGKVYDLVNDAYVETDFLRE